MKASVIIPTYRRDSYLVNTIRSVLLQDYPDFELLVVDQSADHTPEVGKFLRNVDDPRYSYYLIAPPSLPAARNFGLARASGEIVIYIDDDVLLDPGFIHAHVKAYERAEQVAAVGGRVRAPDKPVSTHLLALSTNGSWSGGFDFPHEGELETALGCNMSFRRSALEEIDGFDPSYEGNALWEEYDVCFRLRRQGHQIRFEPRAALDHLLAPAGGCREKDLWGSSFCYQNETLFHIKNLGLWLFFIFSLKAFKNHVWPHKHSVLFWTRLKAFFKGVPRGIWLALFPKKLRPNVVWELSRRDGGMIAMQPTDPLRQDGKPLEIRRVKTLDFNQWAVVAHKDDTGLGRQARDIRKVLSLGRHIVIPSERLTDHPLNPHDEVLLPPNAPEATVRAVLQGLQGIIFFERASWHPDLLRCARELGVATVGVPNWEWFRSKDKNWDYCDLFACPNDLALQTVRRFNRNNSILLPWCLDLDSLPARSITGPARTFVHNAGLVDPDDRKGTRDTIKAFLRTRRNDIRLIVRLQKEVPLPEMDERIEVRVGNFENHADLYRNGDVAIQPSKMEGIGFMVLEAVCAGLPVITTDYPPMNEYVLQPELRVPTHWWKRKAFATTWVRHAHLRLPNRDDLVRRIEWCADHDMDRFSKQNRAWAQEIFSANHLRRQWSEAIGAYLFSNNKRP